MSRGIEVSCSRCGDLVRFITPNHTVEQASHLLLSLIGISDLVSYGVHSKSACCGENLTGQLLGFEGALQVAGLRFDVSDISQEWEEAPTPKLTRERGKKGMI